MKKLLLFLLVLPLGAYAQADSLQLSQTQREGARAVAKHWVAELTKAQDIDLLVAITAVPFTFDGAEALTTLNEVREAYTNVKKNKGARNVPPLQSVIHAVQNPESVTVLVHFTYDDDPQEIYVDVVWRDGRYKVCGFKD